MVGRILINSFHIKDDIFNKLVYIIDNIFSYPIKKVFSIINLPFLQLQPHF